MSAKEITATQFKARCLRLLDEVAETGEALVVTKRGKPVASVQPANLKPVDLGGSVDFVLSDAELVEASMGSWDVEQA